MWIQSKIVQKRKATAESSLLRFKAVKGCVVPDNSKNALAASTAWSLKTTLGHIPLEHWKPLTQHTITFQKTWIPNNAAKTSKLT